MKVENFGNKHPILRQKCLEMRGSKFKWLVSTIKTIIKSKVKYMEKVKSASWTKSTVMIFVQAMYMCSYFYTHVHIYVCMYIMR